MVVMEGNAPSFQAYETRVILLYDITDGVRGRIRTDDFRVLQALAFDRSATLTWPAQEDSNFRETL